MIEKFDKHENNDLITFHDCLPLASVCCFAAYYITPYYKNNIPICSCLISIPSKFDINIVLQGTETNPASEIGSSDDVFLHFTLNI